MKIHETDQNSSNASHNNPDNDLKTVELIFRLTKIFLTDICVLRESIADTLTEYKANKRRRLSNFTWWSTESFPNPQLLNQAMKNLNIIFNIQKLLLDFTHQIHHLSSDDFEEKLAEFFTDLTNLSIQLTSEKKLEYQPIEDKFVNALPLAMHALFKAVAHEQTTWTAINVTAETSSIERKLF